MENNIKIENFRLDEENNEIILNIREISNLILTTFPPKKAPDVIKIERYGVVDGKIQLLECKSGTEVIIPESKEVVWDEVPTTPEIPETPAE